MTAGQSRPERILIVDDEEYNVDYLEQNLSDLGFRTSAAYGGREALDQVRDTPPDMILLDVMMPDIDGITVCQMLKSDPQTRLIPIIIMTALDGQEDRIRGIEAGADDFLSKPVDERELTARINTLLRSKRVVDETVGELQSASSRLEELGTITEEGAIAAIEFRTPVKAGSSRDVYNYVRGRFAEAVGVAVDEFDGQVVSDGGDQMVVLFRDSKPSVARVLQAARSVTAVLAELNSFRDLIPMEVAVAIASGDVSVQAVRVSRDSETHWLTEATGQPVDDASRLAALAASGSVVMTPRAFEGFGGSLKGERIILTGEAGSQTEAVKIDDETVVEGLQPVAAASRRLETIFVSDIVGSTTIASESGDRVWTEKLEGHYKLVRQTFAQFGGREVSTAGDGFLALFDIPAQAIRAGHVISQASDRLGLPVRVGIHTGELEETDGDVQGIAVHLASRLSDEAEQGEVVVSSTTKEAVAGSGLEFELKGERQLKGIEGERRIWVALVHGESRGLV